MSDEWKLKVDDLFEGLFELASVHSVSPCMVCKPKIVVKTEQVIQFDFSAAFKTKNGKRANKNSRKKVKRAIERLSDVAKLIPKL